MNLASASSITMKIFLVTSMFAFITEAYPNGAGGCVGGMAAVGPPHMEGQFTNGSLSLGGFKVTLDSKALVPGTMSNVTVGKTHVLTLSAPKSGFFRGVLLRLGRAGGVNTIPALSVISRDINLQVAKVCTQGEKVGGLTHTANSDKQTVSGHLLLPSVASRLPLDITVVVKNDGVSSMFYYSRFMLNAVPTSGGQRSSPPSKKPAKKPTKKPSPPTKHPIVRPSLRSVGGHPTIHPHGARTNG